MSNLPEYSGDSDEGVDCVKCGFYEATTTYRPRVVGISVERIEVHEAPLNGEYLERECTRCGFKWAERPLA